jgi:hypothetical protein
MRLVGRWCFADGRPWPVQRRRLSTVARLVPSPHRLPVVATEVGGVTAERVGPAAGPATVVHFHGGGYCVGGPRLARPWAAALSSATGLPVVLPQYRLAPEHPYPAALDGEPAYDGFHRYGFRVPAVVVSPYARRDHVTHVIHDHTSILAMVERKWNLPALTYRDANAADLTDFLDFSRPAFADPPTLASASTPAASCTPGDAGTIPPPGSIIG